MDGSSVDHKDDAQEALIQRCDALCADGCTAVYRLMAQIKAIETFDVNNEYGEKLTTAKVRLRFTESAIDRVLKADSLELGRFSDAYIRQVKAGYRRQIPDELQALKEAHPEALKALMQEEAFEAWRPASLEAHSR